MDDCLTRETCAEVSVSDGRRGDERPEARPTETVDVVFAAHVLLSNGPAADVGRFANTIIAFGKNDDLVSGNTVFSDRFAKEHFGGAVRVRVGRVPLRRPISKGS